MEQKTEEREKIKIKKKNNHTTCSDVTAEI